MKILRPSIIYRICFSIIILILTSLSTAHAETVTRCVETQKLNDADTHNAYFGAYVAINENYAVIGALNDSTQDPKAGIAYAYAFENGQWVLMHRIMRMDTGAQDHFGSGVALSGEMMIVGAWADDDYLGSAYIFRQLGGGWVNDAKLTASDGEAYEYFGAAVAISGTYAVVGAWGDDSSFGSVYVFEQDGFEWSQIQKLTASDAASNDAFGGAVSMDSNTLAIAAKQDEWGIGAVYIFELTEGTWVESQKITPPVSPWYSYFGHSICLKQDRLIVGAPNEGTLGTLAGAACIYEKQSGVWTLMQQITALDTKANDRFGTSVAIDGDLTVVGARWQDDYGEEAGAAYVFEYDGSQWNQISKLTANDANADDEFGTAVSLSGQKILIGAPFKEHSILTTPGTAYLFQVDEFDTADLNADLNVDLNDAILALQVVSGLNPDGIELSVGIGGDGRIAIEEAVYILQKIAGLR